MDTMANLKHALPRLQIELDLEDYEKGGMTPWFSFRALLPTKPLPAIHERPHLRTARLLIRPLVPDDLDAFWDVRRADTQVYSRLRGRPDVSIDQTREQLARFNDDDQSNWYFGAFLQDTGELIGEGGLPDVRDRDMSASGWPEAEFILKPEHCRKGYGTEFFHAVMDSWWDLPREWQRLQLHAAVTPDKEPGEKVIEGVVLQWEAGNDAAKAFFAKMLQQNPIAASGGFASIDRRPGREGNVVYLTGMLVANPKQLEAATAASG